MSSDGSLDPLRLLQEDLKDDDYELVIASINRLNTIAIALGPTRTRNELIPFLLEFSETDNDEAQTAVARQLGDFTDLVGGPQHAFVLIPLLEKLCGEEEFVVRDAAVDALMRLAPKLVRTDIPAKFIPLLKRLANGDWFTTRVSACGLFSTVYPLCDQTVQTELRSLFNNLCNDDTPMVRKAAYTSLGKFATTIQKQFFKSDIVPILKALSIDDMDSMRIYTIDACAQLAKYIDPQEYITLVLPLIEGLQDDMSWRVRQQLANLFPDLCYQAQPDTVGKRLAPIYVKLIKDKEAEVRTAAATMLSEVAIALKAISLEYFGPVLDGLATDGAQNVRIAFSKSIISLSPAFGKETAGKLLVPLVQQLTKDEHYEVRNNILSRLDVLSEAIGATAMTTGVLPAILELAKDPKWRVRMAVIEQSALLAQHLGVKTFEKKIQSVVIGSLSDHVFSIRERACEQIGLIVKEFGGKWAAEKLFPTAFAIYDKTTNYLHRMTCLLVIQQCAAHAGTDVCERALLPLACTACIDDVPNVRIAAAKTMNELIPRLDRKLVDSKVKPLLTKMHTDTDPDVMYFSTVAAKRC